MRMQVCVPSCCPNLQITLQDLEGGCIYSSSCWGSSGSQKLCRSQNQTSPAKVSFTECSQSMPTEVRQLLENCTLFISSASSAEAVATVLSHVDCYTLTLSASVIQPQLELLDVPSKVRHWFILDPTVSLLWGAGAIEMKTNSLRWPQFNIWRSRKLLEIYHSSWERKRPYQR